MVRLARRWLTGRMTQNTLRGLALIASTLTVGLMAGLYYSYSCSVMPGLRQANDRTLIDAMQRINVAIINPVFMLAFLGGLLLTAAAVALHLRNGHGVLLWIVAGFVLYGLSVVVTGALNIPLNNALDAAGDPAKITDLAAVRDHFVATWPLWNAVRTVVSTAAFGCLTWALVLHGRTSRG
jgi:uncharacterized membrane protein